MPAVATLVVVGVALAILGFLAWLMDLTAPIESSIRVMMIEYRKTRTLRAIRAEGGASRERINAIMRGEHPGPRILRRTGHPAPWIAVAAFLALTLVAVMALTGSGPFGRTEHAAPPSPQERLDAVLGKLKVGDCTNFTADFASHSPPANPLVVSCSGRAATFKVVKNATGSGVCPEKLVSARLWSDAAGGSICMTRVYNVGQCMQGPKVKNHDVSWYVAAVVPCSTEPTRKYPSLVKIVAILEHDDGCPRRSFFSHASYGVNAKYLCVKQVGASR